MALSTPTTKTIFSKSPKPSVTEKTAKVEKSTVKLIPTTVEITTSPKTTIYTTMEITTMPPEETTKKLRINSPGVSNSNVTETILNVTQQPVISPADNNRTNQEASTVRKTNPTVKPSQKTSPTKTNTNPTVKPTTKLTTKLIIKPTTKPSTKITAFSTKLTEPSTTRVTNKPIPPNPPEPPKPTDSRPIDPSLAPPVSFDPCANGGCKPEEKPKLDSGNMVYVVFGIDTIDRSNISYKHVINDKGTVVYDKKFQNAFSYGRLNPDIIRKMCKICKLIQNNHELVMVNGSQCFPSDEEMALCE